MAWDLQTVRITAFAPVEDTDAGLWQSLVGEAPEDVQRRPREGKLVERGNYQGMSLAAESAPLHSQLELSNINTENAPPLPVLPGTFDEILAHLSSLVDPWLERVPAPTRLAFGAVALENVDNRALAYARLAQLVPGLRLGHPASDLMYRINRPRSSGTVAGLQMNRLSIWSAIEVRQMNVLSQGIAVVSCAVALQLDINTAAERREALPPDARRTLIEEQFGLAREILAKGDVE